MLCNAINEKEIMEFDWREVEWLGLSEGEAKGRKEGKRATRGAPVRRVGQSVPIREHKERNKAVLNCR
jgi:hypothetical protein